MKEAIFFSACAVLFIVPLYFVINEVYDDGIIGRGALLGVSFTSATFLLEVLFGDEFEVLNQTVLLAVSFAVFLTWHLFRFHHRVTRKREALPPYRDETL